MAAAFAGALLGAIGARSNRVRTRDEFALWVAAGAIGGPLALAEWWAILSMAKGVTGKSFAVSTAAIWVVFVPALLGSTVTQVLDDSDSRSRWVASCAIKWFRSPIASTAGLLTALGMRIFRKPVDFRRGMLFLHAGRGASALALGGLAWCQDRCFSERCIPDTLARHEAVHSRTVAAVGEVGFYLTYLTAGILCARMQGGPWNSLTQQGCGQPFEKTAHTYTADPAVPNRCGKAVRSTGPSPAKGHG
ncbi:MAG TPA: hypothetical protein VHI31_03600 [Actinomycetota bacterium]|nr:hypothetical protein [Actinomycetota bacterium]